MAKVWGLDVKGTEREILMVMCDHADDFGNNARPSIAFIAWKVGCDARTVTRHIKALRRKDALQLVKRASDHAPNIYRVNLSVYPAKPDFERKGDAWADAKAAERGDKMPTRTNERGDKMRERGDIAVSPEPSFEPDNNNNDDAPVENPKAGWLKELDAATGGYVGELSALFDAWENNPDERRHKEAMRQLKNAHSRTGKVYLKAYLTFNPDYVPPAASPPPRVASVSRKATFQPYHEPTAEEKERFRRELAQRQAEWSKG